MSYTTWELILAKYPNVGKINGASETIAQAYIAQAAAEIDGYLADCYALPFTSVPPLIQDLCTDLIYIKIRVNEPKLIEGLKAYYDERIKKIQSGALKLVSADGTVFAYNGNAASIDKSYTSSFGPDRPENWRPDCDAIIDAEAERD